MSQTKEQIKANISRNITTNGAGKITGEVMRNVLNNMTDNLGLQQDISDLQQDISDLQSSVEDAQNDIDSLNENKVDKVPGKGLSTNDYTTEEKEKLAGIAAGAQVNVLEGVKVDGTELPITDKKVDIDLSGKVDVAEHQSQEDQSFIYRQTGGGNLTIDAKNAELTSIKGKSLVWNQLVKDYTQSANIKATGSSSIAYENGKLKISIASTSSKDAVAIATGRFVATHIVAICITYTGTRPGVFKLGSWNGVGSSGTTYRDISQRVETISTGSNDEYGAIWLFGTEISDFEITELNVIDLTLMFGAGNEPSTVEEFEALYNEPYYPYQPGVIKNNDAVAMESVGFNQWDEEWESGAYNDSTGEEIVVAGYIRSVNAIKVLSGVDYYIKKPATFPTRILQYDSLGNYLGFLAPITSATGEILSFVENTAYIRFYINLSTYNHDICINLSDASRNGTYEPYWKKSIQLGLNSFRVTDGTNIITVNGLKSAGSVYDEIDPVRKKYIKRIGAVDMGTLTWIYYPNEYFGSRDLESLIKKAISTQDVPDGICAKYVLTSAANIISNLSSGLSWGTSGTIVVRDSAYTDTATFKTSMSGVMLYYELATPIEYDLVDPIPNAIEVDENGTERAIFPEAVDPSAPFRADISYSEAHVKYNEIEGMADIINNLSNVMTSDAFKVGSNGTVTTIISLTQSQYDALTTKDPNTVYVIKPSN